ncbi:Bcr/CflA family efflux MFS transporter [Rhodobacteraceae bacterium RKSG542]|uniref:multidrug effflux MFS transporter n=1 Tax=Pseudovibrio flavus TaxID=2529854 RepID=UPI0012BCC8CD|nr:multidrug effflux MFS transporter [Pseudovibrio flavus]MTI19092.1 Bcr/CflA family efflux MFS transporter [Pseudovibrio flavus]
MRDKFLFVVCLSFVFMLAPFAIDMYLPALPAIANDLNTGIGSLEATVAILLIGYAIGQLVLGPLSDRIGQKPVLIGGLIVYAAASFGASFVTSIEQLYVLRLFQAFGGAGAVVVFPMVRARYNEETSTKIISYIMGMTVIAPLIAPIIGGYLFVLAGWPSIFTALAVFGVIALSMAFVVVKPSPAQSPEQPRENPLTSYVSVLSNWRAVTHILTGSLAFAGLFTFVAGSPYVYITHFGVAPENYGYLIAFNAFAMMAANMANAQFFAKINPTTKATAGALTLAVIALGLATLALTQATLLWVVVAVALYVTAMGFTATNAIVGALSVLPSQNGTVSALNGALQFTIGAVASFIVSLLHSSGPTQMLAIMAICGLGSALFALPLLRKSATTITPANA